MGRVLEYHRSRARRSRLQRFVLGSGLAFALGLAANLLPYWLTCGNPGHDGIQYAGFPFEFYRFGGFLPQTVWHRDLLTSDIVIVVVASLAIGVILASDVVYWLARRLSS